MGHSVQVLSATSVALQALLDEAFFVVWGGHELEGDPDDLLAQRGYWRVYTPLLSPKNGKSICACKRQNCLL